MNQQEVTLVDTVFGTVTTRRVIYSPSKGLFGGRSQIDIPIKHITSVQLDTSRQIAAGIIALLVAFVCFSAGGVWVVVGLLCAVQAVMFFWGRPAIVVRTAGQDVGAARGRPWQQQEAVDFVEAIRKQLVEQQ